MAGLLWHDVLFVPWGVAKQGINLLVNQKRKLGLQSIKRLKIDRIVA